MTVTFKKDGIFYLEDNPRCKEIDREGEINGTNFPRWLREECSVDKGVTLRDIMTHVARNKNLSTFLGKYASCPMREFNGLLGKKVKKHEYIQKLNVYWIGEWWDKETEIDDLSLFWSFQGIGVMPEEERENLHLSSDQIGELISWSVSGDISDVLDLPVEINNEATVYHNTKQYKVEETLKREMLPTMLEFLNAIYFDISFYGTPKQAKEQFKSIEDTRQAILNKNLDIKKDEEGYEEELMDMGQVMEMLDGKEKVRDAIYYLISNKRILKDSFEENWELIEDQLDFDCDYSEEDMESFKKFWLFRYLDLVKQSVKDGDISSLDQIIPENL